MKLVPEQWVKHMGILLLERTAAINSGAHTLGLETQATTHPAGPYENAEVFEIREHQVHCGYNPAGGQQDGALPNSMQNSRAPGLLACILPSTPAKRGRCPQLFRLIPKPHTSLTA